MSKELLPIAEALAMELEQDVRKMETENPLLANTFANIGARLDRIRTLLKHTLLGETQNDFHGNGEQVRVLSPQCEQYRDVLRNPVGRSKYSQIAVEATTDELIAMEDILKSALIGGSDNRTELAVLHRLIQTKKRMSVEGLVTQTGYKPNTILQVTESWQRCLESFGRWQIHHKKRHADDIVIIEEPSIDLDLLNSMNANARKTVNAKINAFWKNEGYSEGNAEIICGKKAWEIWMHVVDAMESGKTEFTQEDFSRFGYTQWTISKLLEAAFEVQEESDDKMIRIRKNW